MYWQMSLLKSTVPYMTFHIWMSQLTTLFQLKYIFFCFDFSTIFHNRTEPKKRGKKGMSGLFQQSWSKRNGVLWTKNAALKWSRMLDKCINTFKSLSGAKITNGAKVLTYFSNYKQCWSEKVEFGERNDLKHWE